MASDDSVLPQLLQRNEAWAKQVEAAEPKFFVESTKGQTPQVNLHLLFAILVFLIVSYRSDLQVLWIGCSDSRVPASVVTGSKPGDIFVHRNIAKYVEPSRFLPLLD